MFDDSTWKSLKRRGLDCRQSRSSTYMPSTASTCLALCFLLRAESSLALDGDDVALLLLATFDLLACWQSELSWDAFCTQPIVDLRFPHLHQWTAPAQISYRCRLNKKKKVSLQSVNPPRKSNSRTTTVIPDYLGLRKFNLHMITMPLLPAWMDRWILSQPRIPLGPTRQFFKFLYWICGAGARLGPP